MMRKQLKRKLLDWEKNYREIPKNIPICRILVMKNEYLSNANVNYLFMLAPFANSKTTQLSATQTI